MQQSDLRPASEFAKMYGCKCLIYGPPGSAKTPLISTAPRPVMLATEAGLLSMRTSNVPTYQAFTPERIDEFFKWFFHSNENKNFDTLAIDSAPQMADVYLQAAMNGSSKSGKKVHGLAAYGEMATAVMDHLRPLFFMQQKHAYVICKETTDNQGMKRPYFPGQQLNVDVPHLYDFILHLGIKNVPSQGQVLAFQCNQNFDVLARNRTGNLNDYEPPNFNQLVQKAMS